MDVENEAPPQRDASPDNNVNNIAVCVRVRPQDAGNIPSRSGANGSAIVVDTAAKSLHIGGQSFAFDHTAGSDTTQVSVLTWAISLLCAALVISVARCLCQLSDATTTTYTGANLRACCEANYGSMSPRVSLTYSRVNAIH